MYYFSIHNLLDYISTKKKEKFHAKHLQDHNNYSRFMLHKKIILLKEMKVKKKTDENLIEEPPMKSL